MRIKQLIAGLLAAGMTASLVATPAIADPRHRYGGPPAAHGHRDDYLGPQRMSRARDDGRREWRGERFRVERYQPPRGHRERAWRKGERLPPVYRGRPYVVEYHRYHLAPPPRGHQYVRVGNDVVLAAVATGIISSVITGLLIQ